MVEASYSPPVRARSPTTDSFAKGVDEPTPTFPLAFQTPEPGKYASVATVRFVVDAFVNVAFPVVVSVCDPRLRAVVAPVYGTYVVAARPEPNRPSVDVDTADTAPVSYTHLTLPTILRV